MIHYDAQKRLFHLQTKNTSYIFGFFENKFLVHLYWGKRIQTPIFSADLLYDFSKGRRPLSAADYVDLPYSRDNLPAEYSTFANTDMRTPALHITYANGSKITELQYLKHEIYDGKRPLTGLPATYVEQEDEAQTLELTLCDPLTGLEVVLSYTAFAQWDAITRSVRIVNSGHQTVRVQRVLSALMDFNNDAYDFIHLPGTWARERHPERAPLFTGIQKVESVRGASSCQHNPFFALAEHNATETTGNVYGFNLVYSGNFTAGVEVDAFEQARAFIGINPFDFEYVLKPGQHFQAPEAVLVYSDCGLGGMSRVYHKLYRSRLCRGVFRDRERYVLLNNWEATYMDFTADKIVEIAEKAAQVGVELMVLDDGWFGKRNNDRSSLGDWYVNEQKLPGGLAALSKRIHAMGMKFGLWFEPEMVSPDSDCYRAHPDWCIHVPDRTRSECRHQLMLDLSRDDVCEYIIQSVSAVLRSAEIEYVKWDYNRNMTNIGSALLDAAHQGELCHRYILGLYRVLETLTTAFPQVLFESCSSGGARFDPGMLYYMPQTWCSDDTDAVERSFIQYGTGLCYPYAAMGAHVSACPNHQVGRTTPITARGDVAMAGQLGYELDLNKLTDAEIKTVKAQIQTYKQYGSIFHTGDLYRLVTPENGEYVANEFLAADEGTVLVSVFTLKATPNGPQKYIRLQGLQADALYALDGTERIYGGDVLMTVGVPYLLSRDYDSALWIFRKIPCKQM